jgi:hypothetical protein
MCWTLITPPPPPPSSIVICLYYMYLINKESVSVFS